MDDPGTLAREAALARELSELKLKLTVAEATIAARARGKVRLHEEVEELESTIASFDSLARACLNAPNDYVLCDLLTPYLETGEVKIGEASKPDDTPQKPEFVLSKGYDNEWVAGPFDSAEEARAEIRLYEDDEIRVHHVKYMSIGDWLPTVDDLLETMDATAHDNGYSIDDPAHVIVSVPAAQRALERWAERWIHLENEKWVGDEVK